MLDFLLNFKYLSIIPFYIAITAFFLTWGVYLLASKEANDKDDKKAIRLAIIVTAIVTAIPAVASTQIKETVTSVEEYTTKDITEDPEDDSIFKFTETNEEIVPDIILRETVNTNKVTIKEVELSFLGEKTSLKVLSTDVKN